MGKIISFIGFLIKNKEFNRVNRINRVWGVLRSLGFFSKHFEKGINPPYPIKINIFNIFFKKEFIKYLINFNEVLKKNLKKISFVALSNLKNPMNFMKGMKNKQSDFNLIFIYCDIPEITRSTEDNPINQDHQNLLSKPIVNRNKHNINYTTW